MKKMKKDPSPGKPKERKYFNPYDDYSMGTLEHTYNRRERTNGTNGMNKKTAVPKRKKTDVMGRKSAVQPVKQKSRVQESRQKTAMTKRKPADNRERTVDMQPVSRSREHVERPQLTKSRKLTKKQRLRLKRRRQIRFAFRVMIAMGVTISLVLGIFVMKDYLTKTAVSTQLVQVGSLDTSKSLEGVVLRSEKIVYGQENGTAQFVVAEGEKVKKDGTVYVLVDENKLNATTNQIQDVEEQIYIKAENNTVVDNNQDEKYNLAQEVQHNFEDYYNNCFDSSTSYIYALRSKLDSNVSSRTDLYVAQQKGKDDGLVTQKLELDAALEGYQKGKAADTSGIVSFHMDGHETDDISAALKNMTYDEYNKLNKVTTNNQLGQSKIEKDSPIYKLVLNNNWYIVSYVNEKEDQFVEGNTYKLHFDSKEDQAIDFTLMGKEEQNGKVRLIFKTSNQIGDFLAVRHVAFSIGDKDVSGLKIPISSIVEQNYIKIPMAFAVTDQETIGVYRKKGQVTEFVSLDIQTKDEENQCYYVLQDLTDSGKIKLNDVLVNQTDGKTYQVTESIVKQGVYVVNGKIASFKDVEIIDQSNEYAIVKYNNSSKLKEMDKIISNPKSVKMDQLLDQMKIQNE